MINQGENYKTPGSKHIVLGLLKGLAGALLFLALLWIPAHFLHFGSKNVIDQICADLKCQNVVVKTADGLINDLRRYDLDDTLASKVVPPILFNRFPADLADLLPVAKRKKLFFNSLLPTVLLAREEILFERATLVAILSKYPDPSNVVFLKTNAYDRSRTAKKWQQNLTGAQIRQALHLAEKYKSPRADELLERIKPIPASLILAQSAIESAWGTSRFAQVGNNLFGIWTWDDGDNGLIPERREQGKTHRVKSFDSLLDAVRDYCLLLNSKPAYKNLRKIRNRTTDSIIMADGLINYSARRNLYVRDVKKIIRLNKLRRYDSCKLQ